MAQIEDDNRANNAGRLREADQQLRDRYDTTLDTCPLPRLWGLSLFGTSVRVYCGDAATRAITPPFQHKVMLFRQDSWKANGIWISSRRKDSIK
jgi:hypothetical protein